MDKQGRPGSATVQPIPAYSNIFLAGSPFRPTYSSLFQRNPTYSSLFQDKKIFRRRWTQMGISKPRRIVNCEWKATPGPDVQYCRRPRPAVKACRSPVKVWSGKIKVCRTPAQPKGGPEGRSGPGFDASRSDLDANRRHQTKSNWIKPGKFGARGGLENGNFNPFQFFAGFFTS